MIKLSDILNEIEIEKYISLTSKGKKILDRGIDFGGTYQVLKDMGFSNKKNITRDQIMKNLVDNGRIGPEEYVIDTFIKWGYLK